MEKLDYEVRDAIAVITLNDPPANTYSYEMMQQRDRAILNARMDESVQVIVITGKGEKFFCAGADIQMLASVTPTYKYYFCLHANETLNRLEQTPKLVIAAINGHCVGGGLEVAMAADLRLVRLVGKAKAMQLMVTGELMDFERAHELGILTQIFEADTAAEFAQMVHECALQFTTPNKAAHAVGRIKRAVQTGGEISFESALALERELQQQLFQSEDAREGLDAYVNKRKAEFKGR